MKNNNDKNLSLLFVIIAFGISIFSSILTLIKMDLDIILLFTNISCYSLASAQLFFYKSLEDKEDQYAGKY